MADFHSEAFVVHRTVPCTTLDAPELSPYAGQSESRLFHWYEPAPGLFIAESAKVLGRALAAGYEPVSVLAEDSCLGLLPELPADCPVYTAPHEVLRSITGYELTGGILSAMRRRALPPLAGILPERGMVTVLQRVTNPTNAGAIVRSAAALGVDAVIFTGGCADPLARRAVRVGMGCIFQIPWTVVPDAEEVLSVLEERGFVTAAMALRDDARSLGDLRLPETEKLAVFLGNEGDGLPVETVERCALSIRIPMREGVDSLNVAAASAVAFWELRKRIP